MRRHRGFEREVRAEIARRLLERDGTVCAICETALDSDLALNDPTATTIDHIVPISEGGEIGNERSIGNLRLTHSRCNGLRTHRDHLPPKWFAAELRRAAERSQTTPSA